MALADHEIFDFRHGQRPIVVGLRSVFIQKFAGPLSPLVPLKNCQGRPKMLQITLDDPDGSVSQLAGLDSHSRMACARSSTVFPTTLEGRLKDLVSPRRSYFTAVPFSPRNAAR